MVGHNCFYAAILELALENFLVNCAALGTYLDYHDHNCKHTKIVFDDQNTNLCEVAV